MLKGQPKGLFVLALANMGERFGYYTMLAIFVLYMQAKFGFTTDQTSTVFGVFLSAVYFLPLIGGFVADKWLGYGKTITLGIVIMFCGYLLLAYPTDASTVAIVIMFAALSLIALGTGFFKGNLQALVGNLYDDPRYSKKRDLAFSVFYMCINIGAFFAPSAAQAVSDYFMQKDGYSYNANIPALYHQLNRGEISPNAYINLAGYAKGQNVLVLDTTMIDRYSQDQEIAIDTVASVNTSVDSASVAIQPCVTLESRFGAIMNTEQIDKTNVLMDSLIKKNFGLFICPSTVPVDRIKSEVLSSIEPFADSAAVYSVLKAKLAAGAALIGSSEKSIDSDLEKYDPKNSSLKKQIDGLLQSAINAQIAPMVNREQMLEFSESYTVSMSKSFNYSFAVACFSLVVSILIFLVFRRFYAAANKTEREKLADIASGKTSKDDVVVLTAKQTKDRMVALGLVFAVVIFFWMAFHQNGLTMTFFARDYTQTSVSGFDRFGFSLLTLLPFAICFYGVLNFFQGKGSARAIAGVTAVVGACLAYWAYSTFPANMSITPQIFQQFNAFFIVILTPVAIAFFSWLNKKGKEPLAPRKIGIGMIIAALGFVVLALGSIGLPTPSAVEADGGLASNMLVSPNWLISTYFILTIAELFLSPMGMSFVSKVAPPKYKGLAQGGWLAATAVGNYLVAVVGYLWGGMELWMVWGLLVTLCLLSATFLFSQMKKLERTTREA